MVAVVDVSRVFQNCVRMIYKHKRVEEHSIYVLDAEGKQPYPAWKRIDTIQDYLHEDDKGKAAGAGRAITEEEYMGEVMDGTS